MIGAMVNANSSYMFKNHFQNQRDEKSVKNSSENYENGVGGNSSVLNPNESEENSRISDPNKPDKDSDVLNQSKKKECKTCKNRKYQDGSNDPGVSYKSPTKIDAKAAGMAVRRHEMEHVVRERYKAQQEGRKVVSQTVTMHSAICPECGKAYISGGTTRTVTSGPRAKEFQAGLKDPSSEKGVNLDMTA